MDTITLASLFEEKRGEIVEQFNEIYLPRDAAKLEKVVSGFLKDVMAEDSAYRQSLTPSENTMLESTWELMQAQGHVTAGIAASLRNFNLRLKEEKSVMPIPKKLLYYYPVLGAAIGTAIGSFWGTWTAIGGAVLLTAIAVYVVTLVIKLSLKKNDKAVLEDSEIDPEVFAEVIGNICDKIDNVMETFRAQVKRNDGEL